MLKDSKINEEYLKEDIEETEKKSKEYSKKTKGYTPFDEVMAKHVKQILEFRKKNVISSKTIDYFEALE